MPRKRSNADQGGAPEPSKDEGIDSGAPIREATFGEPSKARLAELFAMAMAYRNWSQRALADFLGRDVHNVIPPSGVPKVDLIVRLAKALDWPAAAVLEDVCGTSGGAFDGSDAAMADFAALNRESAHAALSGRHADAVSLAVRAALAARTPEEAAEADRREAVAWDGLGRYHEAIESVHRGLRRTGLSAMLRASLRANLASCYLALGQFDECEGVCSAQLEAMSSAQGLGDHRQALRAHLLGVRGQAKFWRIDAEPEAVQYLAEGASSDLASGAELWEAYAKSSGHEGLTGHARTYRGCLLALDADSGRQPAARVMEQFIDAMDGAVDLRAVPPGDRLESYGWWSIFGTAVVMRHSEEIPEVDRCMAILTNKAYEVAELTGNWSLRERAFNIDYLRGEKAGLSALRVLDLDDVNTLVGTMGRFPAFRNRGWELYRRSPRI